MAREAHELALLSWVAQGTDLAADAVVFMNTRRASSGRSVRAPRRPVPYATVHVSGETGTGTPDAIATDEVLGAGFAYRVLNHRSASVIVQIYGEQHAALMALLESSLEAPAVTLFFAVEKIAVTKTGGSAARLEQAVLDTIGQDRSSRTFLFRFVRITDYEVGSIESSEVAGNFTGS